MQQIDLASAGIWGMIWANRFDAIRILPLEQAAEAHRLIEAGNATGKLLLQVQQ